MTMRSADLDAVLIGGREPATFVVVDYDDAWPVRFEALADRVRRALGGRFGSCRQGAGRRDRHRAAQPRAGELRSSVVSGARRVDDAATTLKAVATAWSIWASGLARDSSGSRPGRLALSCSGVAAASS